MPDLEEVIKTSTVIVHKERYAYLKSNVAPQAPCFMVSKDKDEVTVVCDELSMQNIPHTEAVKWFKLLEIKVSQPFVAKGFLAKVSKTVADEDLNILIISTFSKDYALVREETHIKAVEALQRAGFPIVWKV